MGIILEAKLHLREELEILLVKIVLKPALLLSTYKKKDDSPVKATQPVVDSDPENDDFIQV